MDQARCFAGQSLRRSASLFGIWVPLTLLGWCAFAILGCRASFANSLSVDDRSQNPSVTDSESNTPVESPIPASTEPVAAPTMTPTVQIDPLNSPHPVPWNWVMATLSERGTVPNPRFRYYRSQSLISPDGQYAAYSRIQMQLSSDFTQSRVASVLFLENLQTGDLQTITASSPFADNPFIANAGDEAGTIAILIPIAWSETGDRVLAREFESIFGSDIASDFAVVWDRRSERTYTIAPSQVQYSNAVLLGWSQTNPTQVLFRAGMMGNEDWSMYAVDVSGQTAYASNDQPVTFGEVVNSLWSGPQAYMKP